MEVRDLDRNDLGMLCVAVGPHRKRFVSMIFGAIVEGRGLHVHVERDGRDYLLVCIETSGDAIVAEHRLPMRWSDLDEVVRLCVLQLYLRGLRDGHRRWRRRIGLPLGTSTVQANDS